MRFLSRRVPLIYWLPVILYYAFITFLSGTTPQFPAVYAGSGNLDKFFHFIEYIFFGLVLARDLFWQKMLLVEKRGWLGMFLVYVAILVFFDEFHQHFVPQRFPDVLDALADAAGALVGALVYVYVIRGRRARHADTDAIDFMRERDRRRFSLFVVVILFFVIVSVNILKLKQPLSADLPLVFALLNFTEWAALGFFSYRCLWLLFQRPGHLHPGGWLLVILTGLFLLIEYALIFEYFRVDSGAPAFLIHAGGYFFAGMILGMTRTAWRLLKSKVSADLTYRRESTQRLAYFLPPIILWLSICLFASLAPQEIAADWLADGAGAIAFYAASFFALGIMGARAVLWESWWHEPSARRVIFAVSIPALVLLVIINEILKAKLGGQGVSLTMAGVNMAALGCAWLSYAWGLRSAQRYLKSAKHAP